MEGYRQHLMENLQANGKVKCQNSKLDFVQPLITNINISRGNRNFRPGEFHPSSSQTTRRTKDKYATQLSAEMSQQYECSDPLNPTNNLSTSYITQELKELLRQHLADSSATVQTQINRQTSTQPLDTVAHTNSASTGSDSTAQLVRNPTKVKISESSTNSVSSSQAQPKEETSHNCRPNKRKYSTQFEPSSAQPLKLPRPVDNPD